ncbi:unnamed protein product [Parajaminaea phylloscopi]
MPDIESQGAQPAVGEGDASTSGHGSTEAIEVPGCPTLVTQQTCPNSSGSQSKTRRELRRIVLNFTPSWFSVNMGTGIVSILLHELPYQFRGLHVIANIIFGLNVGIFALFLTTTIARYAIWPKMLPTMLFHPDQSLFLGTFAMGMATIVNMCALSAAPHWGSGFVKFTWALWWIDAAVSLCICIGLPFLQFTHHKQSIDKITAIWLLPVVSTVVAAASGGIVSPLLQPSHARLTLIVSWILLGTGLSLAFFLMVLYYLRLAVYKIPPATMIVSVFLPLGPCGQGAYALLKLSMSLWELTENSGEALATAHALTKQQAEMMAASIYGVSIIAALLLWGLGLVWLVLAIAILLDLWIVSELHFNLGMWAFTFPLGVFASATCQLGKELDSAGFRVLGTVFSVIVTLLWLCIACLTLVKAIKGKIFFSPCLAEIGGEPSKGSPGNRQYVYQPRPEKTSSSRSQSRGRPRQTTR